LKKYIKDLILFWYNNSRFWQEYYACNITTRSHYAIPVVPNLEFSIITTVVDLSKILRQTKILGERVIITEENMDVSQVYAYEHC